MIDLRLTRVSKRYIIQQTIDAEAGRHSVRRSLQRLGLRRTEEFWALRDVSFEVERGETLGIIGHNGAGKSTIFKLLSNVTAPTSGEIAITGQLSALIEVGSGFHPELTGRENIYLSGSILARIAHRDQPAGFAIDWRPQCAMLRVDPGRPIRGTFYMPHRWRTLRPDAISASDAEFRDATPGAVAS